MSRDALPEGAQPVGDLMRPLRREIELDHFDRNQPAAFRIFAAKNGTKAARADLMQHAEAAERRRNAER
jgi:hypothetical protein